MILNPLINAEFKGWLVELVVLGFNGPLRQYIYFSLFRAISQREGERKEK